MLGVGSLLRVIVGESYSVFAVFEDTHQRPWTGIKWQLFIHRLHSGFAAYNYWVERDITVSVRTPPKAIYLSRLKVRPHLENTLPDSYGPVFLSYHQAITLQPCHWRQENHSARTNYWNTPPSNQFTISWLCTTLPTSAAQLLWQWPDEHTLRSGTSSNTSAATSNSLVSSDNNCLRKQSLCWTSVQCLCSSRNSCWYIDCSIKRPLHISTGRVYINTLCIIVRGVRILPYLQITGLSFSIMSSK